MSLEPMAAGSDIYPSPQAKPWETARSAPQPESPTRFGPAVTSGFAVKDVGVEQACVQSPLLLRAKYVALGTFLGVAFLCKVRPMKAAGSLQG